MTDRAVRQSELPRRMRVAAQTRGRIKCTQGLERRKLHRPNVNDAHNLVEQYSLAIHSLRYLYRKAMCNLAVSLTYVWLPVLLVVLEINRDSDKASIQ